MKSTRTELSQERPRSDCQETFLKAVGSPVLRILGREGVGSVPLQKCLQDPEVSRVAVMLDLLP